MPATQKILLFGFPHTGTTIFRNILGHIDDVDEMIYESRIAFKATDKPFIVVKYPFTWEKFFEDEYKDYIKIFVVRNPLWVFSSLNKRFSNNIPADHNMWSYFDALKKFAKYSESPIANTYLIRYEDMFDDNYAAMRAIFDKIGFTYTDRIFQNAEFTNTAQVKNAEIPVDEPEHTNHSAYRMYQVNQPFVNNNDMAKLSLNHVQKHTFATHPIVQKIYPEVKEILKKMNEKKYIITNLKQQTQQTTNQIPMKLTCVFCCTFAPNS